MDREKSRGGLRIPSHTLTIIYGITGLLHYDPQKSPFRSPVYALCLVRV